MGASFPFFICGFLKAAFIASSSAGLVETCQNVREIGRFVLFVIKAWPLEQRGKKELLSLPEKNARKQLMEPGHVQGYADLPLSQRTGYPMAFYLNQGRDHLLNLEVRVEHEKSP